MKKISIFLVLVLSLTSCLNDFLDVQPVSETYSGAYWKTENEARAALTTVYADMQVNFKPNLGINYIGWFEIRSDNFYGYPASGNYPFNFVNQNQINPSHPSSDWNVWYKSIATTNYAIKYIPGMSKLTELKRDNLLAEAYFLRAYCYFNLIRIWGNVPLVNKPTLTFDDVVKPFKDSTKVIMDSLILKDLDLSLKKVDKSSKEIYRFSVGALYALATDVAMWNHDYEKAVSYSKLLYDLTDGSVKRYTLVNGADFSKVCSSAITTENIWTLKWSYLNNGYNPVVQSLTTLYVLVAKPVVVLWATPEWSKDMRRYQTIDTTVIYKDDHLSIPNIKAAMWKYEPKLRVVNNLNEKSIPMYRLADIILLRAEALNKLDRKQEALDELNKIRTRAGLKNRLLSDYDSKTDKTLAIEDDILQERQFELLGEGKRWFDLMRTERVKTTMNNFFNTYLKKYGVTNYVEYTYDWQFYWPVFQDNIVENSNLTQTGLY